MLGRSAIEKNRLAECLAIGLYPVRDVSIFFSVSSATYNMIDLEMRLNCNFAVTHSAYENLQKL